MKYRLVYSNLNRRYFSASTNSLRLEGINGLSPTTLYITRKEKRLRAVKVDTDKKPRRKRSVAIELKPDKSDEAAVAPTDTGRARVSEEDGSDRASTISTEVKYNTTITSDTAKRPGPPRKSLLERKPALGALAAINNYRHPESEKIIPEAWLSPLYFPPPKKTGPKGKVPIWETSKDPAVSLAKVNESFEEPMVAMKRSASATQVAPKAKKPRVQLPEYEDTPSVKGEDGEIVWPAPKEQIERAREFILESAKSGKNILIVPDKDADGLTSGAILQRTLRLLGVSPSLISIHHLSQKGSSIHVEPERALMAATNPSYIFVLDQGSRRSPPVIDAPHKALIIDHHHALPGDFPEDAQYINASQCPPVVTSSLLTYLLCEPLHPDVKEKADWLACMGTHGDLGPLKWRPPFPDMAPTLKKYGKSNVNDAVSLLNAPRRTAEFNVSDAWAALADADEPKELLKDVRLLKARAEVNAEVERCSHSAPKFSYDGRVSVQRISSPAQVHPVIATKWAGFLKSAKLEVVMCANEGYLPGMVNFSCRVARDARARETPPNIIEILKSYAAEKEGLVERLGESFARGHKEASGGVVPKDAFEELMVAMRIGEKPEKAEGEGRKKKEVKTQKNTLAGWVVKPKEKLEVRPEVKVEEKVV